MKAKPKATFLFEMTLLSCHSLFLVTYSTPFWQFFLFRLPFLIVFHWLDTQIFLVCHFYYYKFCRQNFLEKYYGFTQNPAHFLIFILNRRHLTNQMVSKRKLYLFSSKNLKLSDQRHQEIKQKFKSFF